VRSAEEGEPHAGVVGSSAAREPHAGVVGSLVEGEQRAEAVSVACVRVLCSSSGDHPCGQGV
jgi:hypothetical protein